MMTERSTETLLIAVLGWPVAHTLSPRLHRAAATAAGIDLTCVSLPVKPTDLKTAIQELIALGFRGASVTIPHKQSILPLLDGVDPAARAIGAVNTLFIDRPLAAEAAFLRGYNTDWTGFLADLRGLLPDIGGKICLVLGAGGAARAVVYALAGQGAHCHVFARRPEQARLLAGDISPTGPAANIVPHAWGELASISRELEPGASPLIVNTTPVGMTPKDEESPWPQDLRFPEGAFVYDLVYSPPSSKLLRLAAYQGCSIASGLGMLVEQGALAFRLWTGVEPNRAVMLEEISKL